MGNTKIFVLLSRSSWYTAFLLKTLFKLSNFNWSQVIASDRKICMYFVGLWKSLLDVSQITTIRQSLRGKNQIPSQSARKDEEFGQLILLFFKLLLHKLLTDCSININFCKEIETNESVWQDTIFYLKFKADKIAISWSKQVVFGLINTCLTMILLLLLTPRVCRNLCQGI